MRYRLNNLIREFLRRRGFVPFEEFRQIATDRDMRFEELRSSYRRNAELEKRVQRLQAQRLLAELEAANKRLALLRGRFQRIQQIVRGQGE